MIFAIGRQHDLDTRVIFDTTPFPRANAAARAKMSYRPYSHIIAKFSVLNDLDGSA